MEPNNNKRSQMAPREMTICGFFLKREVLESKRVPELRLRGKWLEGTEFGIGKRVVITIVDGKLVIELAKEQPAWILEREKREAKRKPEAEANEIRISPGLADVHQVEDKPNVRRRRPAHGGLPVEDLPGREATRPQWA
jgi:Toxin SymE, type I toxin-antitoxin system